MSGIASETLSDFNFSDSDKMLWCWLDYDTD